MPIDFRAKGLAYERKIARQFSQWWCGNPLALWRNTNSGARATVMGEVYSGDIIPAMDSAVPWPFSIEIKKSEQWSVDNFLNGNDGEPLLKYMIQCLESADVGCNTYAMLICAKNHKKPLCFLHAPSFGSTFYGKRHYTARLLDRNIELDIQWPHPIDFYVMHLETFFKEFKREDFT